MASIVDRTLDCGLRVLIERVEGVRSASLVWLTPAGAASDPTDRLGQSALWGELVLRGAGRFDSRAQADALDRVGANRATSTSSRFLSISLGVVGARLGEALPLVVDMVLRPRFDESSIGPAKDLAIQAIEALRDDPGERAGVALRARHFASPFNRSTLGSEEGITLATREDLVEGWRARARPRGSIVGIAGAVDPEQVVRELERLLVGWEGRAPEPLPEGVPARGYAHEIDQTNQVQIVLAHDAPAEGHPDAWNERAVAAVLSGGMSSRLFSEVREKRGLCYSVGARYSTDRDFGVLTADVGTQPDRAQQSLDVLWSELERVHSPEGRVTREEFDRAIVGMKSRLVFSGESTGARAGAIASDAFKLGRARSLEELAASVDGLTLEGVGEYLARRRIGRATLQTLGPGALVEPRTLAGE